MRLLKNVILCEEIRKENIISKYYNKLLTLHKGKIMPKIVNFKIYYYLYYRKSKKSNKYIVRDEEYVKNSGYNLYVKLKFNKY